MTELKENEFKELFKELYRPGEIFYLEDITKLLNKRKELLNINQDSIINEGLLISLKKNKKGLALLKKIGLANV